MQERKKGNKLSAFAAILYYEFLWNIRKKKTIGLFIIVFAVVSLQLFLPPLISNYLGKPFQQESKYVFNNVALISSIFIFLLGVATTMNTVSGEFESGSIVPLLTKPVSKTAVFLGKVVAASLTLLAVYAFLGVYFVVGGILVQGSQENLQYVPIGILGLTVATMVWASMVILLGTVSKSSIIAALGSFGIYIGLSIVGALLASFIGNTDILFYTPGDGPIGTTGLCAGGGGFVRNPTAFSTGTNALGRVIMEWVLNPGVALNFCGFRFSGRGPETIQLSSDLVSNIGLRDLGVSLVYLAVLLLVSWFALRRSQIAE